MRRSVLLLTAMTVAIVLASGVALAKAITCPNRDDGSCVGTRKADAITGTEDADDIVARRGGDKIFALGGNDLIVGAKGSDTSDGGTGNDRYLFDASWGKDTIAADASGQDKVRFLQSITGSVRIALDDQHPSIPRGATSGKNKVLFAGNFIENAEGGSGSDTIAGSVSNNKLEGHEGRDDLSGGDGNDSLDGGEGDDKLNGGADDDAYRGSEGEDVVDDASGPADALDLGDHSSNDATFDPLDGSDARDDYEDLSIDLGGGDVVLIKNYFDNSAPKVLNSGAGTGQIENIRFSDDTFDFGAVHDLIGVREKDPVVASGDSATTNEDTPVVIDVLGNDTGPNLSVKAASLGDPAHGTATLITDVGPDQGKVRYDPDLNYNNTAQSADTFTYEACDDIAPVLCDEATVSVTVDPVNDKPSFASQGDQTVAEDSGPQTVTGWATFDPGSANESGQQVADYIVTDENGDALNSNLFTQAGQPDVSNGGALSYTPAQDAHGSIPIKVTVKDDGGTDRGGVDTGDAQTFTISITSRNDLPTISNIENQTIDEDGNTGALGFTIGDVESAVGDLKLTGSSSDTTLVPNTNITFDTSGADTTVTVTPTEDEFGTAAIEVKVEDPDGGSSTEAFQLTVNSVNDAPVANDDTKTTLENVPLVFPASDLLSNDSAGAANESGQNLSVAVNNPQHGTVGLDGGEITFTPDTDYSGPASFEYTICDDGTPQECSAQAATVNITVSRVNSQPTASATPASLNLDEDAAAQTIRLSGADIETGDANLRFTITEAPTHGVLEKNATVLGNGETFTGSPTDVTYRPDADYNGSDSFKFKVTDWGDPDSCGAPGPDCEAARDSDTETVAITVNSVVDPPKISSGGTLSYTENDGPRPVDSDLSVTHPEGTQITEATVKITGNYRNGEDALAWSDNDPSDNITLDVSSSNETAMLTGADSAANYQAALRAITYENTSEAPSDLTRTVTFLATDANSAASAPATRDISVTAVDDPPVAVNDSATLLEDAAATSVPVLGNDTDADGGQKTISSATDPADGTVVLTGGSPGAHTGLTYQPDPNYCNDPPATSPDTFTYTLNGGSTATVSMTVTCVNDAPVADDETFSGNSGAIGNTSLIVNDPDDGAPTPSQPKKTISGDILAGDTDIDGPGPLTVTPGTFATNDGGSVTIESDGDFTFNPAASTSCTDTSDSFDYTVEDSGSPEQTDTGRVTVSIAGCVWYVSNDATGNSGTSSEPFDTLAQAEVASGNNQTVFVLDGDNTSTGYGGDGYAMNAGERLIGEHEGLTVDPDGGGSLGTDTLAAPNAGAHPTLTANYADVIDLDDGNELRGLNVDPQGTGGGIAGGSGDSGGATIDDVNIVDNGTAGTQAGLELDSTTGTFNISNLVVNNSATGVRLHNTTTPANAVSAVFSPTGQISIQSNGGPGLSVNGTSAVPVNLGTSTFDDITVAGSNSGGVTLSNVSGTTNLGDGTGTDLNLTTTSGAAAGFFAASVTNLTVGESGTDDVHATGGPAVDVNASAATLDFDDVDSTGSATDGVNLDGLGTGTFSADTGDIGGASGVSFDLNGGSGDVTYPGVLQNGSGVTAVDITGRTGGTVLLSGAGIADTNDAGGGLNASGNTGGTTRLAHLDKQFNTGASDAVSFTNSDGHTLEFAGGALDIDTTTGNGFVATNSGTVEVEGLTNRIDTGSGRAINISDTDIGNDDVKFRNVSSNGAVEGIRLNNTGNANGRFLITGNGWTCTSAASCTGGAIQSSSGAGISLSSVPGGASLARIAVTGGGDDGIRAVSTGTSNSAAGLAIDTAFVSGNGNAAGERGLDGDNVRGRSSIASSTFTGSAEENARIDNDSGTLDLNVTGSTFSSNSSTLGGDGLQLYGDGTAVMKSSITGSTFTANRDDGFQMTTSGANTATMHTAFNNNTVVASGNAGQVSANAGVTVSPGSASTSFFQMNGGSIKGSDGSALILNSLGTAQLDATIDNITIGAAGEAQSGSKTGIGLWAKPVQNSDAKIAIRNSTVQQYAQNGMYLRHNDGTTGSAEYTVTGNTIITPNPGLRGIYLEAGATATDTQFVCADIGGAGALANSLSTAGGQGLEDIYVTKYQNSTFRFPGLTSNTNAGIASYLANRNAGNGVPTAFYETAGGTPPVTGNNAPCAQPTLPTAPLP